MVIIFKEKEIGKILEEYVRANFTLGGKKIDSQEKYNEYHVTISDWPEDNEKEVEDDRTTNAV